MTTPVPSPLLAASRARTETIRRQTENAIRSLDHDGKAVTFASVAALAAVSRSWLYRDPVTREEIARLRTQRPAATVPSAQRSSADSTSRRHEALLDEITRLKRENADLRAEVALTLGHRRAALSTP